ncbi:hypothetical protein F1188_14915 [Roseospira marina]|uniref:Uncharacterized protein n=1 Tax=Roseospira marina TaxID=140057 RepID=A0A5M6I922_9PROT|nr:hypothetical protein [Roseospira marina]KAA5604701.1 hypothetical protein F1188_14915 [Roseospira marina]MBB4315149.1 hypothetical protein [Roseospira marina]MBB5088081.1 hypothetical protein [Roseospira marina]
MCDDDPIWRDLIQGLTQDDGAAARSHLDAGRPVYSIADDMPPGLLRKDHPDGRAELIRFDRQGDQVVRRL